MRSGAILGPCWPVVHIRGALGLFNIQAGGIPSAPLHPAFMALQAGHGHDKASTDDLRVRH